MITGAEPGILPKELAEKNGIVLHTPFWFVAGKFSHVTGSKINWTALSSGLLQLH